MRRLLTAATLFVVFTIAAPANAYVTDGLYLYMDARNTNSYSVSNPTEWNDISINGRNGSINGSVTLDGATDVLFFDGTSSGTNFVDLDGAFNNWGNGFTIEFIGEFGARVDNWERIFDFGNGAESDNVWVGRYTNTQNLTIEIWDGSTNLGRCHTTGNQLAGRELHHWIITMDASPICRIYMDGVEVATVLADGFENDVTSPSTNGTAYPGLPNDVTRTNNYVGASNWTDPDFEGSIQMIRIYTRALTMDEVDSADELTPTEDGDGDGGGGDGDGGASETGALADTGFDPIPLAGLSVFAIAAGIVAARRRGRRSL
jgi:hypothetical protein